MKLVILYGPPAVGKLTVAKKLAELTAFRLFHNHLTADAVMSLFPHGSESYTRLVREIRLRLLEEAVRADLPGVILTLAFTPANALVLDYIKAVEALGGEVCPVRLYCREKTLRARVIKGNREAYGKIADVAKLEQKLLDMGQPFALIPGLESLELSTETLAPRIAATAIKEHFKL